MLAVIGVGFGRTGTGSLKVALNKLGFGDCYHFTEVLKRRHWARWLRIANGEPPIWEHVFSGYCATTDWPGARYWRELVEHYPEAKVILTIRDPDSWYESIRSTSYRLRHVLPDWLPGVRAISRMTDAIIWDGEFAGRVLDAHWTKEHYKQHIDEVQAMIPSERLLLFDVRDGWPPLCHFLGVDVPEGESFPSANDTQTMHRLIVFVRIAKLLPLAALFFAAYLVVTTSP